MRGYSNTVMRESPYYARLPERKTLANGYVFGAPVRDLGWFATLLMGMASGMAAFFAATFIGMIVALAYLGTFWIKRVFRRQ